MDPNLKQLPIKELNQKLRVQSAELREERARVTALLASIGEGLIATDETGKIVQVNKVALDILGFTRKELINQWFPKKIIALHEDDSFVEPLERPATKVFLTGNVISETLYYRKKDGSKIPVYINASPIFLRGKPVGAIEIFRNISVNIDEERLKSEFISLAAHQLRTPLSSIGIYSNMLKDGYAGKLNRDQNKLLGVVVSATQRMNDLINTLLNITRVEGNNVSIERKPVNIAVLLNELIEVQKAKIIEKNLKLKLDINFEIPEIPSDRIILGEIMNNLISNSIKYTPEGGTIYIGLGTNNRNVTLTVKDNGYGIPKEAQQFIFGKFYRAPNILEYDVTGTGLGLYFSKFLANKLNGDVWFKSKQGSGSSFFFSLPIAGSVAQEGRFKLQIGKDGE